MKIYMLHVYWEDFRLWLGSKISGIDIYNEILAAYNTGKRVGYHMRWGYSNGGKD